MSATHKGLPDDEAAFAASGLKGQRGRIIGKHPWAGHIGTIVRLEYTPVGYGIVVKLDDGPDVPPDQECFLFDGRTEWLRMRIANEATP